MINSRTVCTLHMTGRTGVAQVYTPTRLTGNCETTYLNIRSRISWNPYYAVLSSQYSTNWSFFWYNRQML